MKLEPITLMEGGVLEPTRDMEIEQFMLYDGTYGAIVTNSRFFGYSSSSLNEAVEALYDRIASDWKFYVMKDDKKLTAAGQALKRQMLNRFRYVG